MELGFEVKRFEGLMEENGFDGGEEKVGLTAKGFSSTMDEEERVSDGGDKKQARNRTVIERDTSRLLHANPKPMQNAAKNAKTQQGSFNLPTNISHATVLQMAWYKKQSSSTK